jgi:hypothetical protein
MDRRGWKELTTAPGSNTVSWDGCELFWEIIFVAGKSIQDCVELPGIGCSNAGESGWVWVNAGG